jgi:hypothetical protein
MGSIISHVSHSVSTVEYMLCITVVQELLFKMKWTCFFYRLRNSKNNSILFIF